MSFAGNVGNLMENCGLAQLMMSSFAGEEKMLTGKKFPINICALRFVVVELLCGHMEGRLKYHDLLKFLDDVSAKSNLAKHWVRNLIKSVLLMMLYVRAEREGQFALHLDVCKRMLPYFFAASHWGYARDGVAYVQMMENLPYVLNPLIKGEHIVRLQDGLWNAIWTDMAIESTYMRKEKGPLSLIGVRTQESTVKVWANGHHLCNELLLGLSNSDKADRTKHKEEGDEKIKADQLLQNTLEKYTHPHLIDTHINSGSLVNIYTVEKAGKNFDINKAVENG